MNPFSCRHTWSWPRRRQGRDIQTCTKCGATRDSSIQFTDEPAPELRVLVTAEVTAE